MSLYDQIPYSNYSNIQVPIYARHNIVYREGSSGRFDLTLGHKNTAGKTVSRDANLVDIRRALDSSLGGVIPPIKSEYSD